jgi:hypothetical protein
MECRFLRYLVIAWSILWYAAIVPGHQRGVVTLAGSAPVPSCCSAKDDCTKNKLPAGLRGNCAICDQTAKITPPPVVDLTLRFAGLLAELEPARVFTLSAVQFLAPVDARGPPARV